MADLPQQTTIVQYVADGVEDTYVFAFYVPEDEDIAVYVTPEGDTPVPESDIQELDVDYTVTQNGDPITGGFITFLAGHIPADGSIVTLSRDVQTSLNVEFSQAQNFSGATLDAALDKIVLMVQQIQTYAFDRNLSYRINSYLPEVEANTQLEPLQPGYIWMGATGGGVEAVELEQDPDVSTLRSELANDSPDTNGAGLIGYYNPATLASTTVKDALDEIYENYQLIPPGFIGEFGGTSAPDGWLLCDGTAVSRTTYAALFAAIGTTWGVGNGSTTFNIPDFRRRVSVGSGGSGTGTLGNATGNTGGAETHTMTEAELVGHTHDLLLTINEQGSTSSVPSQSNTVAFNTITRTTESTGDGDPFNIMQPSAVVTKIIKT